MSSLVIGLILALLATLSLSDPAGRHLVGDREVREGNISWALGYVFKDDPAIYLNIDWVLNAIARTGGEPEKLVDAYAISACTLVHEGEHLRLTPDPDHELPDLYQYVCLDRLGASAPSKQTVYDAIYKTAMEKYK